MPTLMEFNTIKQNLELCKELGLDFLELNINMLYCTPDENVRTSLLKYKKEYGIDFTMHYYDTVDVSSTSRYYRNYLYTAFSEIGKYLEGVVHKIVIHLEPGAFMTIHSKKNYVYSTDNTYISRTLNTLKTIREVLYTFGISIVVENVSIHPFMERIYKELHENGFMFCYDVGHNIIYNDGLFETYRQKYNFFISHMHLHNVIGKHDHQQLALGDLDIPQLVEFANQNDVDVVIEVKDSINLRKSVEYIRNLQK